jgi:plastocyanin
MLRTTSRLLLIAVAVLALLPGCGGGDDDVEAGDTAGDSGAAAPINDEGTKDVSADGDAPTVAIDLQQKAFSPTYIRTAPGAEVTVEVTNDTGKEHTFTIDDADIDEKFQPGDDGTVTVTAPDSGELVYYCRYHRRAGMSGAFLAGDAEPSSAPAAPVTTAPDGNDNGYGY